jgi:hypothetical protein
MDVQIYHVKKAPESYDDRYSEIEKIYVKASISGILAQVKGTPQELVDTSVIALVIESLLKQVMKQFPNFDEVMLDQSLGLVIETLKKEFPQNAYESYKYCLSKLGSSERNAFLQAKYSFISNDLTFSELEELDEYMVDSHEYYETN